MSVPLGLLGVILAGIGVWAAIGGYFFLIPHVPPDDPTNLILLEGNEDPYNRTNRNTRALTTDPSEFRLSARIAGHAQGRAAELPSSPIAQPALQDPQDSILR